MKKMQLNILLALSLVLCLFVGCGNTAHTKKLELQENTTQIIDYGDAESFEAALNAGENLEGKIVRFEADELHPQSELGYNVWAGEHLNFISSRHPNIKAKDIVTVKATVIESKQGSWFIYYEKVDNAIENENTIKKSTNNNINKSLSPTTELSTTTLQVTTTTTTSTTTTTMITTTQQVTEVNIFDIKKAVENGDYSLVTPEFKATMDAYEAFYDDYIAFMNRYTYPSIFLTLSGIFIDFNSGFCENAP